MRSRLPLLAATVAAGLATALLSGLAATSAQAAAPVGLHIENGKVVERNGTPFVARGVSHAHAWYPTQTPTVIPAVKALGSNALRLVLSSGNQWTKNDLADVTSLVSQCKANKLICMLEVHDTTGYGESSGAVTLDTAVNYWISIKSALVGQEDYIMLNIGNEAYGNSASTANWASDTSAAIKKLRSNGFKNLIVADAPNWGQDWQFYMRDNAASVEAADPDANTLFSIHMYGVFDTAAEVKDYLNSFVSRGLPIIVGEFGNKHSDGDPDEDTIMSETTRLGLGYLGWSWSGNGGGVEYLDMVTNFNSSQLTAWGQRIFTGANGIKATSKEATIYSGVVPPVTTPPASTRPPVTTPPASTRPPVTTPPVTTQPVTTPPASTRPPVTTPATTAPTTGGCTAVYTTGSSWAGGFVGTVKITAGAAAIKGWSVTLNVPAGASITNLWNGSRSGSTVSNAAWNGSLSAGSSTEFGFQGTGSATGLTSANCSAS